VSALVPAPQRLEHVVGPGSSAGATVETAVDAGVPPEGYVLDTSGPSPRIGHRDEAGLRHGRHTLAQLPADAEGRLPAVVVTDWPDFPVRAFMLDVSRDRVPTRATLERLVGLLAATRYNQLQLYMEHTFAYRGHEAVWRHASPFTAEDVQWLDGLCRGAGIELVPNENTFGHMGRWLRHPAYRDRAELPASAAGVPEVLAPTSDNADFALGLLGELVPNFTSRRAHIGCDEPFELGQGRSRPAVAARGRAAVYAEHVGRIAGPLAADGRQVLVWADVLRTAPEVASLLPEGTVAVAWNYEAPPPPGQSPDVPDSLAQGMVALGFEVDAMYRFEANVAPLAEAGLPFWVAPGTSSWNSFVGRLDNAMANMADAALAGRARGAGGFLLTDWGDNGHPQPPSVSFAPLAYGGCVSWALDANRDMDLAGVLDELVFEDSARLLGAAMVELGGLWGSTGQGGCNASPLFTAVYGPSPFVFGQPDPAAVAEVVERIDAAIDTIARAAPAALDGSVVQRELTQAARLARLGAVRLLGAGDGAVDMAGLLDEQRACWLARARPGGLEDSLARLGQALGT
jgi:hypothetical protein